MNNFTRDEAYTRKYQVAEGVWRLRDIFVNVYIVENAIDNSWVLVDAGLKTTGAKVRRLAAKLFGEDVHPIAIILTHGHFDHVGSLDDLAEEWRVPIYAHYMEKPYLTGASAYPPPDPSVGGGMMSWVSWMYPKGPIDVSPYLALLPQDSTVPPMPEWAYIHTPGHAPGHISLFRPNDKTLIVGDAFVTTKQESAMGAFFEPKQISGPPKYFTYDWIAAADSVRKLAELEPNLAATGHGQIMEGEELRQALQLLTTQFETIAVPKRGKYVKQPALVNEDGVQVVPGKS
ncbi:MAG: MBL fold metallo-hydrolase [Saprospiraceae bacterium]